MLYILPLGLISLQAVPLFREAREQASEPGQLLSVLKEAGENDALQHLLLLKFWNGAYGISMSTMLLYYVTYVLRLSDWERIQVIVGAGAAAGITEAAPRLSEVLMEIHICLRYMYTI